MNSDFSRPQRQSLVGVVVMFTDTFQKSARAFGAFLLIWILRINQSNKVYLWIALAIIVISVAVIAYLKYRNFTFFLDEKNEEFVVNKGIFNKTRIAIPLDKIQQVNINQSLIQRIISVHALEVDTAGSGSKEVSIRAISHDLAVQLKERLLDGNKPATNPVSENEVAGATVQADTAPFIRISFLTLIKTGLTSNYTRTFAVMFAFAITIYQNVEDFIQAAGYEEDPLEGYITAELLLRFVIFIIMGILVLTLTVNLLRTIIRYFDFKITKQKGALLLSYGLLSTRNTILRPDKVQILTIGRNYFQKKLGIQDIRIRQASANESHGDKQQKSTAIEIPGCNEPEKNALLEYLLENVPEQGTALKPSIRKIIFQVVKSILIPVGIFSLLAYLSPEVRQYAIFVPIYILFVVVLIFFSFRNYRLFTNDSFIIKRSGAWDIGTEILAPHKIQAVSLTQYFWHVSSNIGTVTLHTAGGSISFGLADYTELKRLTNHWLYQVEAADKNWM